MSSRFIVVSAWALFGLLGCKADERCERARLELAKSWGNLRRSAIKRKLAGVDVEAWTKVEEKAALLESAFMTPQVTWQSAQKARGELLELLERPQTDSEANLRGYFLSVDAADKQQTEFINRCK